MNSTFRLENPRPTSGDPPGMAPPMSPFLGWCSTFGLVAIAVIVGNTLAVAVLTRKKMLRKRTSFFLISLAVADLMVGTFSVPSFIYQLVYVWLHGGLKSSPVLKISKAMDVFSGLASIFTLTIIALERVYAICFPLRHRTSSRRFYKVLVFMVWMMAGLLSSLSFLHEYRLIQHEVFFLFFLATFFVSMFVMFTAYIRIWITVRSSGKSERSHTQLSLESSDGSAGKRTNTTNSSCSVRSLRNRQNGENDKRLAGTVFIVTSVFVFAWIPFQIINLIIFVACKTFPCGAQPSIDVIYFCKLLQFSNSFLNPVIYSLRLRDFRDTLKKLLLRTRSLQNEAGHGV